MTDLADPIVVVGAGASAVHFAATALELGRRVILLDVGRAAATPVMPGAHLNQLKRDLDDPVRYFLGEDYSSVILPSHGDEYYGLPPNKAYVFEPIAGRELRSVGFAPLSSFAAGGLAEAWTGGAYPFNAAETQAFPFAWETLQQAYGEVASRIGVAGVADDDLSPHFPSHAGLQPPNELDNHSNRILETYAARRSRLVSRHGIVLGRARTATLTRPTDGRDACTLCGRCLWGCPSGAFYTPSITLRACRRSAAFDYRPGIVVERFEFDSGNRVTHVVGRSLDDNSEFRLAVGALVLAAGTLSSGRILLESVARAGERVELSGLMDNRQIHMPFVNLGRIGEKYDERAYQYHQLAVGAPGADSLDYVHGLITTLKTAMVHPIVQSLPLGIRASTALFRNVHAALGLLNINFPDQRRETNRIALETGADGATRLLITYTAQATEPERIRLACKRFRDFLAALDCIAPPGMTRVRPMGASVHYAGTLPMTAGGGDFTTDRAGHCRPFANLVIADGSTFPALPAKNLTFTLMANATRIAREAFS